MSYEPQQAARASGSRRASVQRAWPAWRWAVVGLWIIWAGLLFGGEAFGQPQGVPLNRMPTETRIASSALLVVAGWIAFYGAWASSAATFAALVAIGMTLGMLGDLFNANLLSLGLPVRTRTGSFELRVTAHPTFPSSKFPFFEPAA